MDVKDGFVGTIGHPPLIRLAGLSEETGCEILGKAEFLNPGGALHHPRRRAARRAQARQDRGGRHRRQYRHRPGAPLRRARLPLHRGDPRHPVPGKDGPPAPARRRGAPGARGDLYAGRLFNADWLAATGRTPQPVVPRHSAQP